eukprot:2048710-Rhodomonas_salina.1
MKGEGGGRREEEEGSQRARRQSEPANERTTVSDRELEKHIAEPHTLILLKCLKKICHRTIHARSTPSCFFLMSTSRIRSSFGGKTCTCERLKSKLVSHASSSPST